MEKEIEWLLREKYNGKSTKQFYKDIERLKMGEPLDYVIGFAEFLGCKIDLSCKPLIPRPETEYWVGKVIEELKLAKGKMQILDIFSGSGCIGISIMRHIKNANIVFAEKDKKYVKQIKINTKINKLPSRRYKIIQSDVFNNIKGKYDYILANPPYISTKRANKIQKSVLQHEPRVALFGGEDGLSLIRRFLAAAKNRLTPNGKIYMEFDYVQKKDIEKLLQKFGYKNYQFHKDQYGRARYVVIENKI